MPEEGSQPLKNARHERFACEIAKGKTKTEAFRLSGLKGDRRDASLLGQNPDIQKRVKWIQSQAATETVLNIREKREFLARVVRTPLSEVDADSDLCQEHTETTTATGGSTKYRMCDKLAAIKLDNDLEGTGAEAGANKAIEILIRRQG